MTAKKTEAKKPAPKKAKNAPVFMCWSGFATGDGVVVKGGAVLDADAQPFTAAHPLVKKYPRAFTEVAKRGLKRSMPIPAPRMTSPTKRRERAAAEAKKETDDVRE